MLKAVIGNNPEKLNMQIEALQKELENPNLSIKDRGIFEKTLRQMKDRKRMTKFQKAEDFMQECAMQKSKNDQWESEEIRNTIVFISNLIEKEKNAPVGSNKERMHMLVEKLLACMITIRAEEISTNFYLVKMFDIVDRELIASIAFEKSFGSFHLKHFELLP